MGPLLLGFISGHKFLTTLLSGVGGGPSYFRGWLLYEAYGSTFVLISRLLACVADETKPRYSLSANQRPKACSVPRVLPGFSIIGSNWLLHIVVLSCTVIGRVDLVEPCLRWRLRSR